MKKAFLIIISLTLIIFTGIALAQAVELPDPGILPDNPFYFLKSFFEEIGTFFTIGELAKTERFLNLAERRLAEAKKLAEKGKSEVAERTMNRYQEQLGRALAKAEQAKMKGLNADDVLTRVSEATLRHQSILIDVYERVPDQAKPAIQRAMENSIWGHEEALKAISGEKKEEINQQMKQEREEIREKIERVRERGVPIPIIPMIEEEEAVIVEEILPEPPVETPEIPETPETP